MSLEKLTRRPVRTVHPTSTVTEAAREMVEFSVGAVVVTSPHDNSPLGIITDRDLVVLLAEGGDPRKATIEGLVRAPIRTASVKETLHDVTRKMHHYGVRRIPIVDEEGRLVGIVSLDDVLLLLGQEMADLAGTIEAEIVQEAAAMATRAKLKREGF
ncbi:MAG: CBS domain-containing protein [Deltaproteobacteria bacterium]|nr:CBS domain-containing protein [Deltaproteobacteria bacterium]